MPTVNANGVELHYEITGPADAPVIAFVNSLGCAMEMWDGVLPFFEGNRVLRYDARGHGRSGSLDKSIGIDDLADDLVAVLDHAGIASAHCVGLSLGGLTLQALASRRPERVRSLVLIATAAHLPPAEFWYSRAASVRADGPGGIVDTIIPRWFTADFRARAPEAVERIRRDLLAVDRLGYARCCEAIATADLRLRLTSVGAPTLVVAGAEDAVATPAMAEGLRSGIRGAELVVLPNVAHLVAVERPGALAARVVAFLGGNQAAVEARTLFDKGLLVRKAILGEAHVDAALKNAGAFGMPWQEFITRTAWGDIWSDPALPRKSRSLLTLAMMIALHHETEFKLHLRPALNNGVTIAELGALIRHAAVYAGVPAANGAMRWARDVLGDELQ